MVRTRQISRLLTVITLVASFTVIGAAPASAGCVSGTRTFSGTIEGEDGRFVHAMIGIELFAGNQRVDAHGCPSTQMYHIAERLNTSLGAEGAESSAGLTKTWSVQVPSNVTRAFVEVYPRSVNTSPPGGTDKARYGSTMHHDTPITERPVIQLPLNCGLFGGGVSGGNGTISAQVFRNGKPVTPDRVHVFSLGPNDSPKILGWTVADIVPGGFEAPHLAPNQHYQVFVTQGGSTKRALWIPLERCAELDIDIHMEAGAAQTVDGATFYVSNSLGGGAADQTIIFGYPSDEPVALDWDGNGLDDIGIRKGNTFEVLASMVPNWPAKTFSYGRAGDELFIGDWDGNGTDTLAVRRKNVFHVRNDTNSGPAHFTLGFGRAGDEVMVGDWDGDGKDTFAVRRGNIVFLRNDLLSGPATVVFGYGRAGDEMMVGDWDGDGNDTFAVRRGAEYFIRNDTISGPAHVNFRYGRADDTVLVGDWDANGTDTFSVYR